MCIRGGGCKSLIEPFAETTPLKRRAHVQNWSFFEYHKYLLSLLRVSRETSTCNISLATYEKGIGTPIPFFVIVGTGMAPYLNSTLREFIYTLLSLFVTILLPAKTKDTVNF